MRICWTVLLLVFSALHTVLAPVCNLFRCICLSRKDFCDGLDTAPRNGRSWLCAQLSSPLLSSSVMWTWVHWESFLLLYWFTCLAVHIFKMSYHAKHCSGVNSLCNLLAHLSFTVVWHIPSFFGIFLVASFQLECLAQLIPLVATAGKQGLSSSSYNPISTDHFLIIILILFLRSWDKMFLAWPHVTELLFGEK